ncbi:hypothetical protein DENSPDRAFT_887474 [Dentipellis sp. KUC8613]|nr:hypothetical protein DENSPDRAFT_887474 [Dentipellis sp. KUC8613]
MWVLMARGDTARFILSADTLLEPEGGETKIHYQDDFDGYLEYLVSGLRERAPSVMAIFAAWNKKFFPDADSVDDDTVSDVYTESPRSDSGRHNEDEDTLATVLAALREETLIASGSQPDQANTETPRPPEAHHLEGAEKRARDGSPENPENLAADISLPPPSKRIEIGESNIASSSTVAQANGATRVTKQKRRKRR